MVIKIVGTISAINNRSACLLKGMDEYASYVDRVEKLEVPDKIGANNVDLALKEIIMKKMDDTEIIILAIYQ